MCVYSTGAAAAADVSLTLTWEKRTMLQYNRYILLKKFNYNNFAL